MKISRRIRRRREKWSRLQLFESHKFFARKQFGDVRLMNSSNRNVNIIIIIIIIVYELKTIDYYLITRRFSMATDFAAVA